MALETYRKKRNFTSTSEPAGEDGTPARGHSFVIQKHAARRLHYDFRLEMEGVLKSWAVAKGPSLAPGEKRLAVHVEDHPLEYGDFEGTIPKGEYGGGEVIVWDRGQWSPIGDARKGYAKGHLDFTLDGEKLGGRWHLVRMAAKRGDKHENWLLIKGDDEAARPDGPDILDEQPKSVKTGRRVEDLAGEAPGWSSKSGKIEPPAQPPSPAPAAIRKAKQGPLPGFVDPALATLAAKAPAGARWLHEIKFDGYRLLVRIEAGRVRLLTRSGLDWTAKFGKAVVQAFEALPVEAALIDGELVVENANGASDFSALQADLSEGRTDRFVFYAFDLLYLDGYDLRACRLVDRKTALMSLLGDRSGLIRFSASFGEDGALILRHACRLSLEGVVSKLRDGPYRSGRGKGWIKSKCSDRQKFVIGGYVPSTTLRQAIGSLVMGYHDSGKLIHAGRVGTGYTAAVAEDLFRRLERIRTDDSPFSDRLSAEEARQVHYVRPELVAEVEFRGWTADRHLRHASFRGLREDKPAAEIVQESPAAPSGGTPRPAVKLTHPDRLYWPDAGVTKEGLADYYAEVWRHMAPFVVARPLALVRCPGGVTGECFFQKHAWHGASRAIRLASDPQDPSGEPLLTIDDLDGLIGLVQAGVLEVHPWGSSLAALEQPDMIIMDLDPAEGVAWAAVIAAAREVRDRLDRLGLASFVKTSGGKGLHVVAPLDPQADWAAVKPFAKALADGMAADSPDRFVSVVAKTKRHGKILVDYLRNGRGATAVAPYSTRARPGAAVSMPLAWDELGDGLGPAYFTVGNAPARLARLRSDPWAGFRRAAVPLPEAGSRKRRAR
ncbi:MAG TPA: DNA ligase D [Aliidongia sp.]|nr:DNA ligase D [Aliidongia sp.]